MANYYFLYAIDQEELSRNIFKYIINQYLKYTKILWIFQVYTDILLRSLDSLDLGGIISALYFYINTTSRCLFWQIKIDSPSDGTNAFANSFIPMTSRDCSSFLARYLLRLRSALNNLIPDFWNWVIIYSQMLARKFSFSDFYNHASYSIFKFLSVFPPKDSHR